MKIIPLIFASLWFAAAICIGHIIWLQGISIGGMQYFAHVGMSVGILVESALALSAVLLGAMLWTYAYSKSPEKNPIAILALSFSALTFYTYACVYTPMVCHWSYVHLGTFPREQYTWFPITAVILGILTANVSSKNQQS